MTIPLDKVAHALTGAVIVAALLPLSLQVAVIGLVVLAIGKEIVDKVSGRGTPDVLDAAATVFGGATMLWWLQWLVSVLR